MKKAAYVISAAILLAGCAPHKYSTISNREARRNNQQIQKDNRESITGYTPLTSQQYIARYKDIAIKEMNQYGIPASITLAQGLYESGSGNSELARVANNHFGIKCTYDWKGKSYYKDDDEHNDCFRVYDRAEDSFRDHSNFLKRKNYAFLFTLDKNDYKGWAYGLKKAGYANNPIEDGSLKGYRLIKVPINKLTAAAAKDTGLGAKEAKAAWMKMVEWLSTPANLRAMRKSGRRDALAINPQTAARLRAYLDKAGHSLGSGCTR